MFPNMSCTVYRRQQFEAQLQKGLRVIDRVTPDLVAINQPIWFTEHFVQQMVNERATVQEIIETEGLVWTTPNWTPREQDVLVLSSGDQFEIRNLAHTSMLTISIPQHAKFSTTRIEIPTLGPGEALLLLEDGTTLLLEGGIEFIIGV